MPEDTKLVEFADDVAAVIIARTEDQAKRRIAQVTRRVGDWLHEHGLELAAKKTEMVVLTRQRSFPRPFSASVCDENIVANKAIRYLGLTVDEKLTFWTHIEKAAGKATVIAGMLSRLMPHMAGPRSCKRRAILGVVHSIILYGAEIWADALKVEK